MNHNWSLVFDVDLFKAVADMKDNTSREDGGDTGNVWEKERERWRGGNRGMKTEEEWRESKKRESSDLNISKLN